MVKMLCPILLILTSILTHSHAISLINNVTVPSDILTNILFDQVKHNKRLSEVSFRSEELYDSEKCLASLREIINRFPSLEVLPFIDAWGRIPSGILFGHFQELGHYDECIQTSVTLNEETGLIKGQYCLASIPLIDSEHLNVQKLYHEPGVQSRLIEELIRINVAICVPDSCDPKFIRMIFQEATNNTFDGALSVINIDRCEIAEKPEFKAINIFGIVFFSFFGLLIVLSTIYDIYTDYYQIPAQPILLAYSLVTNGRILFSINTSKSPNTIDCLVGIRVLSMIWVLFCHTYSLAPLLPLFNAIVLIDWFKAASTMHVTMATVSVDSFLFLSGLLLAWLSFRELDKSNGRLNIRLMYLHRYIRLTPPVLAVMLFYMSINPYVGDGPIRKIYNMFHGECYTDWWSTLLYIQNYATPTTVCVPQTWYLAVDTQLYVLSPLILIPLWKWGNKFAPVLVLLSVASVGCVITTFFQEGYTQFLGTLEENQTRLTYAPTHTRYSVWLIGIGLGYFMHVNKHKTIHISKTLQLFLWTLCFGSIFGIIYGPYFTINADRETTTLEVAIYEPVKRVVWAFILSWIVFACHFGLGGKINTFLSHVWWQPLGRLTYSMYLVHMAVQSITYGIVRTDFYFSDYTMILYFWSTFGISVMAAIALTLTFESPILVIEKELLGGGKSTNNLRIDIKKCEKLNQKPV